MKQRKRNKRKEKKRIGWSKRVDAPPEKIAEKLFGVNIVIAP